MSIEDAEAIPIRIALKEPFHIAVGTITHTNHVLVRMTDDAGRVGWGEAVTFHPVYGYDQRALYQVLTDHLIPAVRGLDPRDIVTLHEAMDRAIPRNLMAKTGLDIAAYDLAAQSAGQPLHVLCGGKRVERVPQIGVVGILPEAEAAESAVRQLEEGYRTVKMKIGHGAAEDAARVRAVREAVGESVPIRVDGNCGYDRATALRAFRLMEDADLEWIEQPLPGWDLEGMAGLAARLDTPMAVDESMYTPEDAFRCITSGAADVVNIKVAKCGGIYRSQKIAATCEAAGVPCFLGGCIETGVGTAAALHFYAATSNVIRAAEVHGSPHYVDDVVVRPFVADGGSLPVPTGPGLGIEVDEDKVNAYRISY
jgi:o-succinylbenzoate synthase